MTTSSVQKKWLVLMGALILVISSAMHAQDSASVAVKTAKVIEKQIGETLIAYGTLEADPDQILSLSMPHAGLINRVWVRLGQRVKQGDKLLEVITAPDARMQYLQAQSAVDYSTHELERNRQLFNDKLVTRSVLEMAQKDLKDAKAALDALQQRGLDKSIETLLAPMDGIITNLGVSQGERVQADSPSMLIATEQRLIVRLGIEPEDLPRLQIGTEVTLTSIFMPDTRVESRIREIHAMIDPATRLVEVLAPIPTDQVHNLILGSQILGYLHLPMHNALLVPRSAVLGEAPNSHLFIVSQGVAQQISVKTGLETGDETEIMGPVSAGDIVVTLGNYELSDGMTVRETE